MKYIATEAVVPLRAEGREGAEMVSQLLFGEACVQLEAQGTWWRVRSAADGYEGWLSKQMLGLAEPELTCTAFVLAGSLIRTDGSRMPLPIGSRLPIDGVEAPFSFSLGGEKWLPGKDLQWFHTQPKDQLLVLAGHYRNSPYLWGGRSNYGIDCSGLSQMVYRMCGITIPRDSSQQAMEGVEVEFGQHQPGDLAFFSRPHQSHVSHVGFVMDSDQILHASGRVRLDPFRSDGLYRSTTEEMSHKLVSIRRYS